MGGSVKAGYIMMRIMDGLFFIVIQILFFCFCSPIEFQFIFKFVYLILFSCFFERIPLLPLLFPLPLFLSPPRQAACSSSTRTRAARSANPSTMRKIATCANSRARPSTRPGRRSSSATLIASTRMRGTAARAQVLVRWAVVCFCCSFGEWGGE